MKTLPVDVNQLGKSVLEIKNLSVNRSGKVVLKDINLTVCQGEFVGLVGPNGSGKSTLLLTILGVLKPQDGNILVYGDSPLSRKFFGRIGWVSQAAANLPREVRITVREMVQLGTLNAKNMFHFADNNRRQRVDKAIEMVDLKDVENVDISRLSGGQRQRAVIALSLIHI